MLKLNLSQLVLPTHNYNLALQSRASCKDTVHTTKTWYTFRINCTGNCKVCDFVRWISDLYWSLQEAFSGGLLERRLWFGKL